MSRHVLARASISSWPVMKTKMSCDGGASWQHTTTTRIGLEREEQLSQREQPQRCAELEMG